MPRRLAGEIAGLKQQAAANDRRPAARPRRLATQSEKDSASSHKSQARAQRWSEENFDKLSPRDKSLSRQGVLPPTRPTRTTAQLTELTYRDGDDERRVTGSQGRRAPPVPPGRRSRQAADRLVARRRRSDSPTIPAPPGTARGTSPRLLDILTKNPDVWKKTIFILTYDENDGYFDHVPPFVAPHPRAAGNGQGLAGHRRRASSTSTREERARSASRARNARDSPIGLGYRVPLVIASPWSRGGCVCSQVFDHTSPLQFLEKLLIAQAEPRGSRDEHQRVATDRVRRSDVRLPTRGRQRRTSVSPSPTATRSSSKSIAPSSNRFPPDTNNSSAAEIDQIRRGKLRGTSPATRARRPPILRAALRPGRRRPGFRDGKRFLLTLEVNNENPAAAGHPSLPTPAPATPTSTPATTPSPPATNSKTPGPSATSKTSKYHVEVHGPNGFHRAFRGNANDPPVEICLMPAGDCPNFAASSGWGLAHFAESSEQNVPVPLSAVVIEITNHDRRPHTIHIADVSYATGQQSRCSPPARRHESSSTATQPSAGTTCRSQSIHTQTSPSATPATSKLDEKASATQP